MGLNPEELTVKPTTFEEELQHQEQLFKFKKIRYMMVLITILLAFGLATGVYGIITKNEYVLNLFTNFSTFLSVLLGIDIV